MKKDLNLKIEKRKGYLWIILPDSIKIESKLQIQNRIESKLTDNADHLALDLSNTANLYSIIIGLIMRLRKRVTESGGSLCLVNVSKKCRLQLQSMNLDKVLAINENENEISNKDNEV